MIKFKELRTMLKENLEYDDFVDMIDNYTDKNYSKIQKFADDHKNNAGAKKMAKGVEDNHKKKLSASDKKKLLQHCIEYLAELSA